MKYRWAPMQLTDHHYGPWSMFLIDHRIAQQHASETVHLAHSSSTPHTGPTSLDTPTNSYNDASNRLGSLASQSLKNASNSPSSTASPASRPKKGPTRGSATNAKPTELPTCRAASTPRSSSSGVEPIRTVTLGPLQVDIATSRRHPWASIRRLHPRQRGHRRSRAGYHRDHDWARLGAVLLDSGGDGQTDQGRRRGVLEPRCDGRCSVNGISTSHSHRAGGLSDPTSAVRRHISG